MLLVAVHGNGGGGFRFERMHPYIPDHVDFLAPTLPGFADVPRDPALKSMRDYAAKLRELIGEQNGRPLVLLGTGIGGSICLEYIQHYRADGLILHAPVGTRLDERLFPRLMKLPGMTNLGQWLFSTPLTRPAFKRLLFVDYAAIPRDYLNRFFDEYRSNTVFGQMFDIINSAWWNALKYSEIPAALLWGERERVLSVDQLEDYKALLPNHIVRTVPEWDHFPMIESPQEYAEVVIQLAKELIAIAA
ncbi:MAG: alpha/beta hydrolase, partial [Chloroflexota bacterium]